MSFVRRFGIPLLGIVLLAAGIIDQVRIDSMVTFGWTAYAPLTSTTFTPGSSPWLPEILMGVGAILFAGWIGYQFGHRRAAKLRNTPDSNS